MQWLVWCLVLPVVQCDTSAWPNELDQEGVLISVLGVNQKLESVEKENDASKGQV